MSLRIGVPALIVMLGACAGAAPPVPVTARPATPAQSMCLQETGSRLPMAPGHCLAGRVVTREELELSGAVGVGDALSRLLVR